MDADAIRQLLSEHSLFDGMTVEETRTIADAGKVAEHQAGEILMDEGQAADSLHFLLSGQVRVSKKGERGFRHDLATVNAGTVIGELGLLGGQVRTARVKAVEDVEHFSLSASRFEELLEGGNPAARKLLLRIARTVATRQQSMNQRIIDLAEQEAHPDGTVQLSIKDIRERLFKAVAHGA